MKPLLKYKVTSTKIPMFSIYFINFQKVDKWLQGGQPDYQRFNIL